MVARYWLTIVWFGPTVRAIALSKSLPTPNTSELFRVVRRVAEGASPLEFADAVAPIAPDPFVPVVSTFEKLTTVIEAATDCDNVAVTLTLDSVVGANARQISEEPFCTFVRCTRTQVRPAPVMPVTVVLLPVRQSAEMNASSSSLAEVVENAPLTSVVALVDRFTDFTASIAGGVDGVFETVTVTPADVA